ncbi:DUF2293 domain-containing protein [Streptomyces sp. NPDC046977]|uniref:DUF2293 domain-containing protein n=1 Tax=Streptomyces sp. NPDC046977 TaxID=3154703 RepID=UPI003402DC0E
MDTARRGGTIEILVVKPLRRRRCSACRQGPVPFHVLEAGRPLCLPCADLGHLVFLPRGDTALTRRARAAAPVSAVVIRLNRRRNRWERQGLFVDADALALAERQCLADAAARAARRARDARRREAEDVRVTDVLTAEVLRLFPSCPPARAAAIAAHAAVRGSGRVGRTAAGRALDEGAVTAAVRASVRHGDTAYDALLASGVPRWEARQRIAVEVDGVLAAWRAPKTV